MLTLSVERLADVVGGQIAYGPEETIVNGVSIDSRTTEPGAVFVAFAGEKVDGHDYIVDALDRGARAALVSKDMERVRSALESARRSDVTVIVVDDPAKALQDLAAYHRGRLNCPVIGVTGSTGKTTTKDLLQAVLARGMRVVATSGNMNNELGVPLTIMRAGVETEAVVLEMAMRGRGQIATLCAMARPTLGLVTNVGETHMELLGSQEAIAEAKGELVAAIPADGTVFLNGDDSWSERLRKESRAPIVTYGLGETCDIRAVDVEVDEDGHPSFSLVTSEGTVSAALPMPGRHNAYNAAAAAAVALDLGIGPEEIVAGFGEATVSPMRMESFTSVGGITVINDAYNASPASMRAAIEALMDVSIVGRRVAILGDMAELGSLTELAHFKLGEVVGASGVDMLVTVGEKAARIADGAGREGMDTDAIHRFSTADEAAEFICEEVTSADAVLVKASRVMGLELIVEKLMGPSCSS